MNIIANVKKIAVLRANALGDFIFVLPALQALRETYPEAEIVLLGRKWHQEFLANRPSPIDRVLALPAIPGIIKDRKPASEEEQQNFFSSMRHEKFDIAIQLHGGGRFSNQFINTLGAKLTVGLKTADAEPLDISLPYIYYQSEILRYLEVVSQIGATTTHITPQIYLTSHDFEEAEPYLSSPFAILHPGATDLRRRWSAENFAAIGDYLAANGLTVYLTGTGTEEKRIVSAVLSRMKKPAISITDKLSLGGFAGLISQAKLLISNDTGPFHLATALNTPVIGLFWGPNLINASPLFRQTTRPLASWIVTCPLCNQHIAREFPFEPKINCEHLTSFVTDITIAQVKTQLDELLSQTTQYPSKPAHTQTNNNLLISSVT